ncbi:MAG: TdeIII family type II restriction endonuclease [Crocosphaera sp.]|nr:TdeIII family type II restriction endonuclease [Crocosphaera sp.]
MDQVIKNEVKKSLRKAIREFFKNKEVKTFHVLDYIFPKERRIRSLIGGLETSMGLVWEAIAKTLAESNGFEIISEKILSPDPFPSRLRNELDILIALREKDGINTLECIERLKNAAKNSNLNNLKFSKPPSGTGVDLHFRKGGIEYVFDVKTTQPNMASFRSFNKQLLEWYAYKFAKDPNVSLEARIAIPFNPFEKNWYDKQHSKIKKCLDIERDLFVENEFWDFCSGNSNTWESIKELFIELGRENFSQEFQDTFEP